MQVFTPRPIGRNRRTLFAGIAAGLILLTGGSAAAYYGIYLPNTPENILKKSISNALTAPATSGKGSGNIKDKDSAAIFLNYALQQDTTKNTFNIVLDAAFSGVKLPVEVRSVDKSLFFKVGDLATLKGVAALYAPETGPLIDEVSKKVSNQWIEVDQSLLNSVFKDEKCNPFSSTAYKFTDNDSKELLSVYDKNEFVSIKNASDDTIEGRTVTKMELGVDQSKSDAFGKELEQTAFFKRINECSKGVSPGSKQPTDQFKGTSDLTVWVDKSQKEIVKLALAIKDDQAEGSFDFTYNKDKVDIVRPESSKPLMQVVGELGPLFQGVLGGLGGPSGEATPGINL